MKIVVLTPVRNEDWILERFLQVTSQFADLIIIADQNSTDQSVAICRRFPKVHLIQNKNKEFNEAERQNLLIDTARKLISEPKILLALDADEILTANSLQSTDWQTLLNAKPGTVVFMEKPDLTADPNMVIRYEHFWPIAYVDDGAKHQTQQIHSIRIPQPEHAQKLYLSDVKVMHYAFTRPEAQNAKMMLYSMLENLLGTLSTFRRRKLYYLNHDFVNKHHLEKTPDEWKTRWEQLGIDMTTIPFKDFYWYEEESLRLFKQHGFKRFWLDNIWDYDWERLKKIDQNIAIAYPPRLLRWGLKKIDQLIVRIKNKPNKK